MTSEPSDIAGLIEQIAALTNQLKTIDHVGRRNRLFDRRARLFERIDAHPSMLDALASLLDHPDPAVRFVAAARCIRKDILKNQVLAVMNHLCQRDDELGREARRYRDHRVSYPEVEIVAPTPSALAYRPKPPGYPQSAAIDMIERTLDTERAGQVIGLLRRAIGLWPCPVRSDPLTSRFGGMPMVPPQWFWPTEEEEPLLFLAQVNCRDLHAAVGANPLPDHGILVFFGDHDDVTGCFPTGVSQVSYFLDTAELRPASPPLEDFEPLVSCGIEFYETIELPDWKSEVIAQLDLTAEELSRYQDLRGALSRGGHAQGDGDLDVSKLFGWPDLIQRDLGQEFFDDPQAGENLLLQIGSYHDGREWEYWGPGGHVYVTLRPSDLAARRFDLAVLEMQCT